MYIYLEVTPKSGKFKYRGEAKSEPTFVENMVKHGLKVIESETFKGLEFTVKAGA